MSAVVEAAPEARILNVSQDEYFADPCAVPSLSQSIAHTLVTCSPLHAWTEHPRLGNQRSAPTKATDEGTLVHKLLLGKGAEIEIIRADDFRTKVAQQARDLAIESGRLPVLEHKYAEVAANVEIIRTNLAAYGIDLSEGESEVPIEFIEDGEHGPVVCRCMMDNINLKRATIFDVKKIRSAHPRTASRHLIEYGYHIQDAAYRRALAKLKPELRGRIDFVFLFVEIDPPFAVLPARADAIARDLGEQRWSQAVLLWERCLRTNRWPSYADSIVQLEAPTYAVTQEMADLGNV